MMNVLYTRLVPTRAAAGGQCEWALVDEQGIVQQQGDCALEQLGDQLASLPTTSIALIGAGERVLSTRVQIEPQHSEHLKQVIPTLVEEHIADDLEDVHIAVPRVHGPGANDVAVISHMDLIGWIEEYASNGVQVQQILPEYTLLPDFGEDIRVLFEYDRALVQYSEAGGAVIEAGNLPALINLLAQTHFSEVSPVRLGLAASAKDTSAMQCMEEAKAVLLEEAQFDVKARLIREPVFQILIGTASKREHGINLLQGGYAAVETRERSMPLKKIAAVAGLFLLLEAALLLGSGFWFAGKAKDLQAQAVEQYKQIFPNEQRVVSVERQFQGHLDRTAGGGYSKELMNYLQSVSSQISLESMSVSNLEYDALDGGLLLVINAPSVNDLEQFTSRLSSGPHKVDLLSANERDQGVVGRVRLSSL